MKKLLINTLCVLLIFSLIPVSAVYSAPKSELNHTASIELLESLDLLPDSLKVNSKVSREMFIAFLIDAMGLGNSASSGTALFDDVSEKDETFSAICTACDLGIINGNGKSFLPKDTVSYNQAIKMLVSALGYGQLAEAKGGYPAGYLSVASSIDLTDGINLDGDAFLNGAEVAVLIYNALNTTVLQIAELGNGYVSYTDSHNQSMLEVYHGIKRFEGQLRGTSGNLLSGDYELEPDRVLVDDSLYKTNGKNFDSLVGYRVNVYYSKSEKCVVAMEKAYTENNVLVVSADQISTYSSGVLKYDDGNREKSVTIDAAADISYNGRPAMSATSELFNLNDGDITFIDSDSDGTYDAIIISDFDNYVVSAVATDEKIIYDLYDTSKVLSIGETDEIFIDDFGNTMYFGELKKYDVISVWKSTDGKNIKMKFSNKEVRGTLTEKSTAGNGSVVVDGVSLEFAKSFSSVGKDIELGSKGIFALDASGKIAAFNPSKGNWEYAYLIRAATVGSPLDQDFMIRVFTTEGNIIILDCDLEKLLIDGYKKTVDEAKAYFSKSQLIRYETNSEGKVVMIDTPSAGIGDDDLLQMTHTAYDANYAKLSTDYQLRWSKDGKLFSGKIPVASDVKVINVPHPGSVGNDDEYYLASISEFKSASYYPFESYKTGNDSLISDVLIQYNLSGSGVKIGEKTPITVVDEVNSALNKNGDPTIKLCAYYNGSTYREYFFEDETLYNSIVDLSGQPYKLKKGDIVRLAINENSGAIKKLELVYNREADELANGASITGSHFAAVRYVKGTVYEKEDNYISITQLTPVLGTELTDTQKELHVLQSSKILIYDSTVRGGELRSGSFSDVRDFKTFGGEASKVVIFTVDGGDISIVVIYK